MNEILDEIIGKSQKKDRLLVEKSMDIADLLWRLMKVHNFSEKDLAQKMNTSIETVNAYLSGIYDFKLSEITNLEILFRQNLIGITKKPITKSIEKIILGNQEYTITKQFDILKNTVDWLASQKYLQKLPIYTSKNKNRKVLVDFFRIEYNSNEYEKFNYNGHSFSLIKSKRDFLRDSEVLLESCGISKDKLQIVLN